MQVQRTNKSATEVSLHVSADAKDLEPIKKHVLGHFVKQVKIPGFRTGKAPLNLVEKHVNQNLLLDEFMEHALNSLFSRALDQEKLRAISQPQIEMKKFVPYSQFEFTAEVETLGQISLSDYKQIKLAKPVVAATAKDVNEVVDSLRQRLAERKAVDRGAKVGDEVIIDFAGKDEAGQPVAGAEGKDYPLILGGDAFIPGFEDNLIGIKAGEAKEFTIAFPKDYAVSALQSKKVTFAVTAKKASELVEPKADDAFAAKAGPFKTLAELKSDIKKQLQVERQRQADTEHQNELIRTIATQSRIEIPPRLIDEQVMQAEEEEKRNLVYQGQTWEEHLKTEGISEEQHRQRQRPQAEERVKGGLVLSEIAERENIQVTPEELEIRLQILKNQYQDPTMQAELDKPENRRDISNRLLTEKTIQKLVDYTSK
jgi:trigger factor